MLFFIEEQTVFTKGEIAFKYISCYSLSYRPSDSVIYMQAFKYISCYSLSPGIIANCSGAINLNTSHVILYPLESGGGGTGGTNLNTSHVILYPSPTLNPFAIYKHLNTSHVILYQISIAGLVKAAIFKYISCYSLSFPVNRKLTVLLI